MDDQARQIYRRELGGRIAIVVAAYPTKAAAARAAGLTVEQLNKWIAGTVKVAACGLKGLADGAGFSLGWLASGKKGGDERTSTVFYELHRQVTAIVEDTCARCGVTLSDSHVLEIASEWERGIVIMAGKSQDRDTYQSLVPWAELGIGREIGSRSAMASYPQQSNSITPSRGAS